MLKEERHQFILNEIRANNKVLSSELSTRLNVSEDTIRRDLRELSDLGSIRRVHGGAVKNNNEINLEEHSDSSAYIPFSYEDREVYSKAKKEVIAKKAVSLLRDDNVILIDGGTTNLELVKAIPMDYKGTVITNCLPIATKLVEHRFVEVYFLGGRILPNALVTVGHSVIQELKEIRADICFLGTRSIDVQRGITDIDREEVEVKNAMSQSAVNVVSVASSDKLYTTQPFLCVSSKSVTTLITELDPNEVTLRPFVEIGVKVL
ncbi:DeoR/GlpR family DNA-binding transcription regulator [Flammeovirga yaeyamensis]|uniref:DeoR/GlpR family DNA-binding transcription regulator n=1 Tax=Flammeovirga yaeyamensis TaxID=367791 RepID=A0AAX1MZ88_9BACT|nr:MULTISPECIES: DeoR/GlpR family DNA-binding transcription regulator [Flammeovirga]ANQ47936.1 DeoR/GlpR transcriptional regulator [Flammeovirga sp. MY04]MBB3700901.1 DeoR/GlpR family transcriptional regulator of sugar metabolism [Flammeovirga yaeyamensis]NMF38009.1 DeoR/GlpR transcriptional regulator [Flammeovirga yaeyamensis]QWG00659.1 DeoR/GlpR family DNA-binding transcription regulator [Flammeovirga yaeyamensis]